MDVFAKKLHYLRTKAALDQGTLANVLELTSHSHISHLEAGRKAPSLELLCRIALFFQVTTDYLLNDAISVEQEDRSVQKTDRSYLTHTGEKLRELRQSQGLTQGELARKLGLRNHTNISFIESRHREPPVSIIVQAARFFGVTTDFLVWDDEM